MVERERRAWQGDMPVEEVSSCSTLSLTFLRSFFQLLEEIAMYTIIIKTLIRWAVMNASAPSGSWSSLLRGTPSLMQRCSIVLDGKLKY